jgi:hypothetical protein
MHTIRQVLINRQLSFDAASKIVNTTLVKDIFPSEEGGSVFEVEQMKSHAAGDSLPTEPPQTPSRREQRA